MSDHLLYDILKPKFKYKNYGMAAKVLVVEDELVIQQMYAAKLELAGFEVRVAVNGTTGLEMAEVFRPDIILLDIRMPEMNGDEMLAHLREKEWGANMRVIILTNISRDEAPHVLRFLHVDRYVVKAHTTPAQVVQITQEVLAAN